MESQIRVKLERVADLEHAIDGIRAEYDKLRVQVTPEDVRELLSDIEAEEQDAVKPVEDQIRELTTEIKNLALQHGETVQAQRKQAVVSTRRKVDLDGLEGFAVAVPAVRAFVTETRSVSIRDRR